VADFSGGPGFLAFVATFAVVVGAILLFRSLSKHLRKVRTHPPEGEASADAVAVSTADATAGEGGTDEPADGEQGDEGRDDDGHGGTAR